MKGQLFRACAARLTLAFTDHEERSVEEESQQLQEIVFDVVVSFLQAKDARWEEGLVFIQSHLINTVPRKEPELEDVLQHHHGLGRGGAAQRSR